MLTSFEQPWEEPQRRVPAWLMSAAFHLVAVLALAWGLRAAAEHALPGEPARSVGIVLSQTTSTDDVEYFDEGDQAAAAAGGEPNPAEQENPRESLPTEAAAADLKIPDLALPGRPTESIGASNSDVFVHSPTLSQGGGRPEILPGLGDAEILAADAARPRPKGHSGPATRLSLFNSVAAEGHTFVFVIDRSNSMGGDGLGGLEAAAQELIHSLEQLGENHQFQIIVYHHKPVYYQGQRALLPATRENKGAVREFFSGLAAFGGTEHELALQAALRLEPDAIFLFTDGGDPRLAPGQIEQIARRRGGSSIHSVQFGFGPQRSESFLQQLAMRCGGSFAYVNMSERRSPGNTP